MRFDGIRTVRPARWETVVLAVWFGLLTALALLFPRSGDDWAWGTAEGIDRLRNFFQHINGRYAGDLLIIGLTRIGPGAAIVVAATVCATLFLVLHLARCRTPAGYGLAGLLFLTMPLGTWRQGVVWLSGFANYATAALVFLIFLAVAKAEWHGRFARPTALRLAAVALIAFVGQLFMEHVTLGLCVLSLVVAVLMRRRRGSWGRYSVAWTGAAWLGAAVMLVNPAYRRAAAGAAYQQVQTTTGPHALRDLALKVIDTLSTGAVLDNVVLNGFLTVLLLILALLPRAGRGRDLLLAALTLGFAALAYGVWLSERSGPVPARYRALAVVAVALLVAALERAAVRAVREPERRWVLVTATAGFVLMLGPLLFVNPVGPRCFYPTYVALLVAGCVLAAEARGRLPVRARWFAVPLHAVAAGVLVFFFVVYTTISHAIDHRVTLVRRAAAEGSTGVTLTPLPYAYWVHDANPYWSLLAREFKTYYDIPQRVGVSLDPNPWRRVPGRPSLPPP